jgi:hypothetical protein
MESQRLSLQQHKTAQNMRASRGEVRKVESNGTRYRHPGGDILDWSPGQPGKAGWRGKPHWHHNGGKDHLPPGSEIPEPRPPIELPDRLPSPRNGTVAVVICIVWYIFSEGTRVIPARNFIPTL